jgi:hypothetical protein
MERCQPANGNAKLSTRGLSFGLSLAVDNQMILCLAFHEGENLCVLIPLVLIRKFSTRRVLPYGTKALTVFVSIL